MLDCDDKNTFKLGREPFWRAVLCLDLIKSMGKSAKNGLNNVGRGSTHDMEEFHPLTILIRAVDVIQVNHRHGCSESTGMAVCTSARILALMTVCCFSQCRRQWCFRGFLNSWVWQWGTIMWASIISCNDLCNSVSFSFFFAECAALFEAFWAYWYTLQWNARLVPTAAQKFPLISVTLPPLGRFCLFWSLFNLWWSSVMSKRH